MYGHKWATQCGESPVNDAGGLTFAAMTWADALTAFSRPDLNRGFEALLAAPAPGDWPPTLPQFRKLCMVPPHVPVVPYHQPAFEAGHVMSRYIERHGPPDTYSNTVVISMLLAGMAIGAESLGFSKEKIKAAFSDGPARRRVIELAAPACEKMVSNMAELTSRYAA